MAKKPFRRVPPIRKKKSGMRGDLTFILGVFLAVILGVVLMSSIANTEHEITNTKINVENVTLPTAINETTELNGRDHISTTRIVNNTNTSVDYTGNVTISDGIGSNGDKTVILTLDGQTVLNGTGSPFNISGLTANVNYTYGDEGYLANSSDRSLAGLIVIMLAIALLVAVVVLLFQNPNFKKLMEGFK